MPFLKSKVAGESLKDCAGESRLLYLWVHSRIDLCERASHLLKGRHTGDCGLIGEVQSSSDDSDLVLTEIPSQTIVLSMDIHHGFQLRPSEEGLPAVIQQSTGTLKRAKCQMSLSPQVLGVNPSYFLSVLTVCSGPMIWSRILEMGQAITAQTSMSPRTNHAE